MKLLNSVFVLKISEGLWKPDILLRAIQSVTMFQYGVVLYTEKKSWI